MEAKEPTAFEVPCVKRACKDRLIYAFTNGLDIPTPPSLQYGVVVY
jgi:hypothetical protein